MMSAPVRNVLMICSLAMLCVAMFGCSSSDDGKSANLQRQLDMEKAARMTAQEQIAALRTQVEELMGRANISPEDLATLHAQVEDLMGRADISPEDLAALQGELEKLRMAQMMAKQREQERRDAQTVAGLDGGLAQSPQPPAWAASDQDTLANLQPGGEAVFSPLSSVVRRALDATFPSNGAAYMKSISSDGEGGFNVTWVINGVESPVHFPADAYNPERFGFEHTDEAHVHYYLFGWTDAFYPELFPETTEDRTDGSTQFDYLDLQGWGLYFGQDNTALTGYATYGVRTMPDNLPTGSLTWDGAMFATRQDANRTAVIT